MKRAFCQPKLYDSAIDIQLLDVFSNAGVVSTTPFLPVAATSAWCLNQVPLGASDNQRIGRRFTNTGVHINATLYAGATTTVAFPKMVLVWDSAPNQGAVIPPFSTVFTLASGTALANIDNDDRFEIIKIWSTMISGNLTAGQITSAAGCVIDEFVDLGNRVTIFNQADSTGLVVDMVKGSLLLYCMSDQAAGTTAVSMNLSARLSFEDY